MRHIKNIGLYGLAFIAALQILLFGLLALACNNAVLGFMAGVGLVECWHWLLDSRKEDEEDY
jgi:hypothetical protein